MASLKGQEVSSLEQQSIFFEQPSLDQKLNPLEAWLDSSQMLMLPTTHAKTVRSRFDAGAGERGLVELSSANDLFPAAKRKSMLPRPSLLQDKKVRP